jgi:hypothetical protein
MIPYYEIGFPFVWGVLSVSVSNSSSTPSSLVSNNLSKFDTMPLIEDEDKKKLKVNPVVVSHSYP